MVQIAAVLLTVLLPGLLAFRSAPRRRLSLIRDEAETLKLLPEKHASSDMMRETLTHSVARYNVYREHTILPLVYNFIFILVGLGILASVLGVVGEAKVSDSQEGQAPAWALRLAAFEIVGWIYLGLAFVVSISTTVYSYRQLKKED